VLILSIVTAIAGLAIGSQRKPTYTAAAVLQVGTVNPSSYGFVQSASELATAFSQGVTAAPVLAAIHSQLGLTPDQATQRLSSEPTPLSPSFRVVATGPSKLAAVQLANVAGAAVIAYEVKSNSTDPQASALFGSYRVATREVQEAASNVSRLARNSATRHGEALNRAQGALAAARLRASAVGSAYQSTLVNATPSTGLVSLLAGAVSATSDDTSKLELFGFIGLLAGFVLSCCLAVVYEQRRTRRASP
ncbi:MAG: hypothetical protein ACYDHT_13170, partial [Solirubrobacteraceae bacterium]